MAAIKLRRGDSKTFTWTITQPNGAAWNLAGCELRFTVKPEGSDEDDDAGAVIRHYWSGAGSLGITVATPTTGVATHRLAPDETEDLDPEAGYVFDMELRWNGGAEVATLEQGAFVVLPDVTRREGLA